MNRCPELYMSKYGVMIAWHAPTSSPEKINDKKKLWYKEAGDDAGSF